MSAVQEVRTARKVENTNRVRRVELIVDEFNNAHFFPIGAAPGYEGELAGLHKLVICGTLGDPDGGNSGIHLNLATGAINAYGDVKVNGNSV